MADITNVKVGVCSVNFNSTDLGHTIGGVSVSYEPIYKDVAVDLYGQTTVEKYLIGEKFTATVRLAEKTIANLRNAIPQSTFAGAANARITIGAKAGKKATDDAAELVLHPVIEGTRAFDIVMHKAYVGSVVEIPHTNEDENAFEVTFEAILDESKSDGNYLGLIGDSTA